MAQASFVTAPLLSLLLAFLLVTTPASAQVTVETVQGATETADDPAGDPEQARILTVRENHRAPIPDATVIVIQELTPPVHIIHEAHYEGASQYYEEPQHYEEPEPDPYVALVESSGWFDSIRLGGSDEHFDDPEIAALEGHRAGTGDWHANVGGVMIGTAYLPHAWLRVPEVRLYIGGGSVTGEALATEGNPDIVTAPTSAFVARFELAAGIQHTFGPISPYAIARFGGSINVVSVDVTHAQLGSLGSETVTITRGEFGVEAGMHIELEDNAHITGGYRHHLAGAEGWGLTFGFVGMWDD